MTQELGQESLSFLANENSAKNMEQTEEDGDDMSALPNSEEMGGATEEKKPEMVRRVLVPPENMRPWDFSSWKDCSLHLATEHKVSLSLLAPGVTITTLLCCRFRYTATRVEQI